MEWKIIFHVDVDRRGVIGVSVTLVIKIQFRETTSSKCVSSFFPACAVHTYYVLTKMKGTNSRRFQQQVLVLYNDLISMKGEQQVTKKEIVYSREEGLAAIICNHVFGTDW